MSVSVTIQLLRIERDITRLAVKMPTLSEPEQLACVRRIRNLVSKFYKVQIEWLST